MTTKFKILSTISFIALAIVLTFVGVWALTDLDFIVGGNISFEVPTPVPAEDLPYLTFYYDNSNMTARIDDCTDTSLTEINIPSQILYNEKVYAMIGTNDASLMSGAFYGCTALTSVKFPSTTTQIGSYTFFNCSALMNFSIPSSVTSIGNNAFYGCTGLTTIAIPDKVTSIGTNAFANCTGLKSVIIGKGLANLGAGVFAGCLSLESINIPDNVTSVGYSGFGTPTFNNCQSLTNITFGSGITSLTGAFDNTGSSYYNFLTTITITATTPPTLGSSAFNNCTALATINVPSASLDEYKTAEVWSDYADIMVGV